MRLTLIRHATLRLEIGGQVLLVDPMLDAPGARAPVRGTPQERPNPLVPLPVSVREAVAGADAALLTHTHVDHIDAAGVTALIPLGLPVFCQPEDLADLGELGLDLRPVPDGAPAEWEGLTIRRTGGRHGREDAMIQANAPVSGFVVAAHGEPTIYIAGDTVWCPEVADAIAAHGPDWIVVNAGGARFLQGGTITMEAADVAAVAEAAPGARVVAVHLEAINHCLETRDQLAAGLAAAGVDGRVAIPADGESLSSEGGPMATGKHAAAIDIINRAHHRREPDGLLDLLADDAELVQYDMDRLGDPRTMSGKDEIGAMMVEIFGRDMTHEVRELVVGDDRISYMVLCEYPDGKRVVGSYVCDLRDGRITRMVGHVSWDE